MMGIEIHKLEWQEVVNDIHIDCSLDVAVHPTKSNIVLLVVPGVDGSLDGYENKYVHLAERVFGEHGAAVVRMSNPFITSFHWESNIRHILEFITDNATSIAGTEDIELMVFAHSAGAAIVAQLAWEYPMITKIMLVNPATRLGLEKIKKGLIEFNKPTTLLVGELDPSLEDSHKLAKLEGVSIDVIPGANHHFSGIHTSFFINSPTRYLFSNTRSGFDEGDIASIAEYLNILSEISRSQKSD